MTNIASFSNEYNHIHYPLEEFWNCYRDDGLNLVDQWKSEHENVSRCNLSFFRVVQ